MTQHGPVLAATDFSEAADEAIRQAQAAALMVGAPLIVCHVLPEAYRVRVLFPQDAGIDASTQSALAQKATKAVTIRVGAALGATDAPVAVEVESGSPHAGILEVADRVRAGLIVLGPGAAALRVARSAHCPVLVARPSPAGGAVLGATDFSDPAVPAIQMAADVAKRRDVDLRVLHCLDVEVVSALAAAGSVSPMILPPIPTSVLHDLESKAHERLGEALARAGAKGETLVARGAPTHGILKAATDRPTALIVVGTRGRTGLSRLVIGSVAEQVISRAPCSVMVVALHPRAISPEE